MPDRERPGLCLEVGTTADGLRWACTHPTGHLRYWHEHLALTGIADLPAVTWRRHDSATAVYLIPLSSLLEASARIEQAGAPHDEQFVRERRGPGFPMTDIGRLLEALDYAMQAAGLIVQRLPDDDDAVWGAHELKGAYSVLVAWLRTLAQTGQLSLIAVDDEDEPAGGR
jgi:hypothetical protein